jgi:hypothetical protein
MTIIDAEYQFDRQKLTFYFQSTSRIDFRELTADLYSFYKNRIWLHQVDLSSLPAHDPGLEVARATGFHSCPKPAKGKVEEEELDVEQVKQVAELENK